MPSELSTTPSATLYTIRPQTYKPTRFNASARTIKTLEKEGVKTAEVGAKTQAASPLVLLPFAMRYMPCIPAPPTQM